MSVRRAGSQKPALSHNPKTPLHPPLTAERVVPPGASRLRPPPVPGPPETSRPAGEQLAAPSHHLNHRGQWGSGLSPGGGSCVRAALRHELEGTTQRQPAPPLPGQLSTHATSNQHASSREPPDDNPLPHCPDNSETHRNIEPKNAQRRVDTPYELDG